MNHPNQATTSGDSAVAEDGDTLAQLNDLLTDGRDTSIGEQESGELEEMYVLPDPDPESGVCVVMGLSTKDELSHLGTFDTDDCTATLPANSGVE